MPFMACHPGACHALGLSWSTVDDDRTFADRLAAAHDDLRAFLASVVRDRHLREDLVQEVALIAWSKRADYDPLRGTVGAWVRGIAAKRALAARERSRAVVLDPAAIDALAAVEEEPGAAAEADALRGCLGRLGPDARALVDLRYGEDLTLDAIARRRRQPLSTVHRLIEHIREGLMRCVGRVLGGGPP